MIIKHKQTEIQKRHAREYARAWRKAHPEHTRATSKRSRVKNKTKIKLRQRAWQIANREYVQKKQRAWYLKNRSRILRERTERMFHLPEGGYSDLLARQDNKCLICKQSPGKRLFAVDHDHTTGHIRGLLCCSCNTGIGHLRDDPALLEAAAKYLRDHATSLPAPATLQENVELQPCSLSLDT